MSHTLMKESIAQEARRLGSVNDQPTSLCVDRGAEELIIETVK